MPETFHSSHFIHISLKTKYNFHMSTSNWKSVLRFLDCMLKALNPWIVKWLPLLHLNFSFSTTIFLAKYRTGLPKIDWLVKYTMRLHENMFLSRMLLQTVWINFWTFELSPFIQNTKYKIHCTKNATFLSSVSYTKEIAHVIEHFERKFSLRKGIPFRLIFSFFFFIILKVFYNKLLKIL